ncbi:hypothetical protein [Escherichia coli]|uniref:hypothetical protein n=1 Tax=Escherichia coli TaxID=562 RepID=UPI0010E862B7|nr:hypothetical protein [Escherichia coli]GCV57791.1 hypothetical protein HmCmsJML046_02302 [Escherichia coli]
MSNNNLTNERLSALIRVARDSLELYEMELPVIDDVILALVELQQRRAAPPAPVAIDERAAFNAWNNDTGCPLAGRDAKTAAWLAWSRRAAMLQGKAVKQSSSIKTSDCAGQGEDIKQASSNEPVSQPYKLPAEVRDAINRLLDSDGSRGTFSAFRCADAREELERLLAAEPVSQRDELPANVIDALEKALQAMSFMGDTLNALDAVCEEDVEYVTPAFEAVREVLEGNSPAIPDGWVAVPVEPTIAILDEFDSIIDYGAEDSKDAWSRLLAAAWIKSLPAAPRQEVK